MNNQSPIRISTQSKGISFNDSPTPVKKEHGSHRIPSQYSPNNHRYTDNPNSHHTAGTVESEFDISESVNSIKQNERQDGNDYNRLTVPKLASILAMQRMQEHQRPFSSIGVMRSARSRPQSANIQQPTPQPPPVPTAKPLNLSNREITSTSTITRSRREKTLQNIIQRKKEKEQLAKRLADPLLTPRNDQISYEDDNDGNHKLEELLKLSLEEYYNRNRDQEQDQATVTSSSQLVKEIFYDRPSKVQNESSLAVEVQRLINLEESAVNGLADTHRQSHTQQQHQRPHSSSAVNQKLEHLPAKVHQQGANNINNNNNGATTRRPQSASLYNHRRISNSRNGRRKGETSEFNSLGADVFKFDLEIVANNKRSSSPPKIDSEKNEILPEVSPGSGLSPKRAVMDLAFNLMMKHEETRGTKKKRGVDVPIDVILPIRSDSQQEEEAMLPSSLTKEMDKQLARYKQLIQLDNGEPSPDSHAMKPTAHDREETNKLEAKAELQCPEIPTKDEEIALQWRKFIGVNPTRSNEQSKDKPSLFDSVPIESAFPTASLDKKNPYIANIYAKYDMLPTSKEQVKARKIISADEVAVRLNQGVISKRIDSKEQDGRPKTSRAIHNRFTGRKLGQRPSSAVVNNALEESPSLKDLSLLEGPAGVEQLNRYLQSAGGPRVVIPIVSNTSNRPSTSLHAGQPKACQNITDSPRSTSQSECQSERGRDRTSVNIAFDTVTPPSTDRNVTFRHRFEAKKYSEYVAQRNQERKNNKSHRKLTSQLSEQNIAVPVLNPAPPPIVTVS